MSYHNDVGVYFPVHDFVYNNMMTFGEQKCDRTEDSKK